MPNDEKNPNTNLARYGTYEPEAAQEERDEVKKLSGGSFLKLSVGRNVLRLLPPAIGQRTPFIKTMRHYYTPEGADRAIFFNCPRAMLKQRCPACAVADRLSSTGNPVDAKKAEDWQPRLTIMTVVIDRANPEAGPQILTVSKTVFDTLTALRDDAEVGVDYCDPIQGFDVIITRTGTGKKDTRYATVVARRPTELGNMEWLDIRPEMGKHIKVPTSEDIIAMFDEAGAGDTLRAVLAQPATTTRPRPQTGTKGPAARPASKAPPIDVSAEPGKDDDLGF